MLVRDNTLSVKAEHYKAGGDGCGQKRFVKDVRACDLLEPRWNSLKSRVVRGGRNASQVKICGLELVKRRHPPTAKVLAKSEKKLKNLGFGVRRHQEKARGCEGPL